MNNIDKIKKLNVHSLAYILMCPGEFDDEFKKDCDMGNCTKCIENWLQEEYKNGFEYLGESGLSE